MKNLLYLLLMLASLGTKAQQTYAINGAVSDEKGSALAGATVFITNSTYITSAGDDGRFSFAKVRPGNYQVVVRLIGFEPDVQDVTISDQSVNITAKLKASNTQLNMVVIKGATDPNRKMYMRWFTKNFIGETYNADQCKIINPEVIKFKYDKNTDVLKASADEFITIQNKALGYNIKYLITRFEYDVNKNRCSYGGYPYFEELKGSVAQQKEWKKYRDGSYLVSRSHFYAALKNNNTKKEGFSVYTFPDTAVDRRVYNIIPVDAANLFDPAATGKDTTRIHVYFIFYREMQVAVFQETQFNGFLTSGYWSTQRLADLTPVDYIAEAPPWTGTVPPSLRMWIFGPVNKGNGIVAKVP